MSLELGVGLSITRLFEGRRFALALAMAVGLSVSACADMVTEPRPAGVSPGTFAADINCHTWLIEGWVDVQYVPSGDSEFTITFWEYDPVSDMTIFTACEDTGSGDGPGDGPGDGTGTGSGGGGGGEPGNSCLTAPWAPECSSNPPGGGGGGGGSPGGNPGTPIAPEVEIVCMELGGSSTSVARGEPIECRIENIDEFRSEGWILTWEKWQFDPQQTTVALPRVETTSGDSTFWGRVAVGGQVTLKVRLQKELTDTRQTKTAEFEVTARSTSDFRTRSADEIHVGPPYEFRSEPPGLTRDTLGVMKDELHWNQFEISVGVNRGYRYLPSTEYLSIRSAIIVDIAAFAGPSGYYYALAGSPGSHCSQETVATIVPNAVLAHEGLNRELGSHTKAAFDFIVANVADIRNRLESLVYVDSTSNDDLNRAVISWDAYHLAKRAPDLVEGHNRFPPNNCLVKAQ